MRNALKGKDYLLKPFVNIKTMYMHECPNL